MSRGDNGWC